jgi:predicted metal-binding protein
MSDAAANQLLYRPTTWTTVLLVCGKCSRKLGGGFGPDGKDKLKQALQTALKDNGHRRQVRVMKTGCMGVCPENAVTTLNAAKPGKVWVVPKNTSVVTVLSCLVDEGAGAGEEPSPTPTIPRRTRCK